MVTHTWGNTLQICTEKPQRSGASPPALQLCAVPHFECLGRSFLCASRLEARKLNRLKAVSHGSLQQANSLAIADAITVAELACYLPVAQEDGCTCYELDDRKC